MLEEMIKNFIGENSTTRKSFTLEDFKNDLINLTENKNFNQINNSSNRLNAYDIVHSCIRAVLFKMLKYEITSYKDVWLPLTLRHIIGTSCHNFIQNTSKTFTEKEVYLRIPSKNISVKIDCIINNNIIVEIKSCNYKDYEQIFKKKEARTEDLHQALLYKYLLENFLEESKSQKLESNKQYNIPKFDKYNIDKIQLIYICHELLAADSSIEDSINFANELKNKLNSKYNDFWFINIIDYDLTKNDYSVIINYISNKLDIINEFLNKKEIPEMSNKYVDKKKCYFCLYKSICEKY